MPSRHACKPTLIVMAIIVMTMATSASASATTDHPDSNPIWRWEEVVSFPPPSIYVEEGFSKIEMGDLSLSHENGLPMLPYQSLMIPLPQGHSVTRVSVAYLEDHRINLSKRIALAEEQSLTPRHESDLKPAILSPQRIYPAERTVNLGVQTIHMDSFLLLVLYPAVMDSIEGSLVYASEARITIEAVRQGDWSLGPSISTLEPDGRLMDQGSSSSLASSEYLIITSSSLEPYLQPLVEWKEGRGEQTQDLNSISVEVATVESITSNPVFWGDPLSHRGTGNDTQTQIRNFIIDRYLYAGTRYVLLAGDEDVIPCRKVWVVSSLSSEIPADIYYAGLDGDWDADGDGIYGEGAGSGGGNDGEEADLFAEISVGRVTADSGQEVSNFVAKAIEYERVRASPYLNDTLLVGERLDGVPTWGADYKEEIRAGTFPEGNPSLQVQTLYDKDGTFSGSAFVSALNSGVHLVNHMGHGSYDEFADLGLQQVSSLTNQQYFILVSQACFIGGFDFPDRDSIAEELLISEHGAVAMVANSRQGWYSPGDTEGSSQQYDREFFDAVFKENIRQLGPALNDAKMDLASQVQNVGSMRWCYMTLNLLGDPETCVHFVEEREHDVYPVNLDPQPAFVHQSCVVSVEVGNRGPIPESDVPVELIVDGAVIATEMVDVEANGTAEVNLTWIPDRPGTKLIEVRTILSIDQWPYNDRLSREILVGIRVTGSERISDEVLGVDYPWIIEEGGHLSILDSTLFINGTFPTPPFTVLGGLELVNCSLIFDGDAHALISCGNLSEVLIDESHLENEGGRLGHLMLGGGTVRVASSSFRGAAINLQGAQTDISNSSLEGTLLTISNATSMRLRGSALLGAGLSISNSSGEVHTISVSAARTGMGLMDCHDLLIRNCSVHECLNGLLVRRSLNLTMGDNSFTDNTWDISFEGSVIDHFLHSIEGNVVTGGEVLYLKDEQDFHLDSPTVGYLALVSCSYGTIDGLDLGGNGEGLLLINSSHVTTIGCRLDGNLVGVRMLNSVGCLLWGNDFTSNLVDLDSDTAVRLNGTYSTGGNYWDSHSGVDDHTGSDQQFPGSDGIGDAPFQVDDRGNLDHYPLMLPATVPNAPPLAGFRHSPNDSYTNQPIQFLDMSYDPEGSIINWTWDWGDGNFDYSRNPTRSYADNGNYTVVLTVMDNNRQRSSASETIRVNNRAPIALFSHSPPFPQEGDPIEFSDGSYDQDGQIVSWYWDFGDGSSATVQSPTHSYAEEGKYSVTLSVRDDDGGLGESTLEVVVGNDGPCAGFSVDNERPLTGQSVAFTDGSYDPDGTIVEWFWDFGDGGESRLTNPSHAYGDDGHFQVRLDVRDDSGEWAFAEMIIEVMNRKPQVSFAVIPMTPVTGAEAQFIDGSFDPDGEVTRWYWDFGDGSSSDDPNPVHVYLEPENFTVTLTIWDDDGGWNQTSADILVYASGPHADFTHTPSEVYSLTPVKFLDLSCDTNGQIVNWTWSFGDGVISFQQSPLHSFNHPGTYTITLRVRNDLGLASNHSMDLTVSNLAPIAGFTWQSDQSSPFTVFFQSTSYDPDGPPPSHHWHFGDGQVSTEINPMHVFAGEGNYTVSLIVIDEHDNSSLIQIPVWIRVPDLAFEIGSLEIKGGLAVGDVVSISVVVINVGSCRAENATIALLVDGVSAHSAIFSIEAEANLTSTLFWTASPGDHTIVVLLDSEGTIHEADESNNMLSLEVSVPDNGPVETTIDSWVVLILTIVLVGVALIMVSWLRLRRRR